MALGEAGTTSFSSRLLSDKRRREPQKSVAAFGNCLASFEEEAQALKLAENFDPTCIILALGTSHDSLY